jgi:hypothetical protein
MVAERNLANCLTNLGNTITFADGNTYRPAPGAPPYVPPAPVRPRPAYAAPDSSSNSQLSSSGYQPPVPAARPVPALTPADVGAEPAPGLLKAFLPNADDIMTQSALINYEMACATELRQLTGDPRYDRMKRNCVSDKIAAARRRNDVQKAGVLNKYDR